MEQLDVLQYYQIDTDDQEDPFYIKEQIASESINVETK